MKFLIAAGGTAGHVNPAIATADALRKLLPGCEIMFVGAGRKIENRLVPQAGYEIANIEMSGLRRGFSPKKLGQNLRAAAMLITASRRAERLITSFAPDAAIGTGGYICYPVLKAAAKAGIPTVMHESNAEPGLTTRMLSGIVSRVFTAFPGYEAKYKDPARVTAIGTPVRESFIGYTRFDARRELSIPTDEDVVVSFMGSLGASGMNERMKAFLTRNAREKLVGRGFRHIHAAGSEAAAEELKKAVSSDGKPPEFIDIRAYIDDMPRVMASADLVLCRAGGSTLAELSAMGRAAVLVPSPYVANDEQTENARAMCENGGAVTLCESDATGDSLFEAVSELLRGKEKLKEMEVMQQRLGSPTAAARLAEEIVALL
ncbi:MAG: UDP-N-acetylglucosamine--N-acetylmuramyl-(pentapeptide) pyrophosphoryl-undecaprenol N-acetylglucosamine transferase [Oscillospiraceae bacterium]|jgi:UDP-N-acetylglucosamine--N-acetylmuramyl-(pentapeptide) pyrophosphoryl-undecaprenol N-acetylglucosamine transferase|nr:UDP-N-acetylglucosamine--N-acetylmuramyl-(pentapeptide) pyrophosphoryl-undecaprenol N-acetylglucosamine transferase [Oscillospiraceae bacterium]